MKVLINTIKQISSGFEGPSRYGNPNTRHTTDFYKFLINGENTETKEKVYFYTPNVEIRNCEGIMNYSTLNSSNGWMTESKPKYKGVKGFDGSTGIFVKTVITPSFKENDIIEVSGNHTWTSPSNGAKKYNRVKLVK